MITTFEPRHNREATTTIEILTKRRRGQLYRSWSRVHNLRPNSKEHNPIPALIPPLLPRSSPVRAQQAPKCTPHVLSRD